MENTRHGQCKSWLDGGLQPRAMTRDLDWEWMFLKKFLDPKARNCTSGWMPRSVTFLLPNNGLPTMEKIGNPIGKVMSLPLVHFIGKDNIVFHCLIFPAILKAHGEYNLPVNVPANQFLNLEEQKISTSRNWAIWVHEFLGENPDQTDGLRYVLTKNMPEQKDAEFTWKSYQSDVNADLVGTLANFVQRVMVLFINMLRQSPDLMRIPQ
jgi:methionyl-tRNA synthetase